MALHQSEVSSARRSRRRAKRVEGLDQAAHIQPPLPPTLESLFQLIAGPVSTLERSGDTHAVLREIGILLGDFLDLLEEEPAILQAADRLYSAALDVHETSKKRFTCAKITRRTIASRSAALHAALTGLRVSLRSAKPSARAKARVMAW